MVCTDKTDKRASGDQITAAGEILEAVRNGAAVITNYGRIHSTLATGEDREA